MLKLNVSELDRTVTMINPIDTVKEYLSRGDWRVKANANQGYSLGGLILNTSGKVMANYWLCHVYPKAIAEAHRNADFHIHDIDMLAGYCAGWSLRVLLAEGFNGVPGKVEAAPAKHLSSAIGQIVNFLGTLQNEWAGAQAFSSFDTYLAPFIRIDNLSYETVKQNIQELIFNLNVPSRWGTQTPFTNLTFDWVCPEDLKDQAPIIAGKEMSFKYGDLQVEMDMINKAYIEVMTTGDAKGRIFTFPIPTYNITEDFLWDSPNAKQLFEMTAKYGLPYFQNFINSNLKPNMVRSMCCRLQLNLTELLKRGNGLFGSAEQTGSIGVVTINCARLGYLYKDLAVLYKELDRLLELAKQSLEIKRRVVQEFMDNMFGAMPEFFKSEEELRKIWSNPTTRKAFLEKIAEIGYGKDELEALQKMIDAEQSDLFDVLAYISFLTPPISRIERVEKTKNNILEGLEEKQKEFLDFVLAKYEDRGVEELDEEKLPILLNLKYHAIADAEEELGSVEKIRSIFFSFQKNLYAKVGVLR